MYATLNLAEPYIAVPYVCVEEEEAGDEEEHRHVVAAQQGVEKQVGDGLDVAVDVDFIPFQDYESLRFYRNVIDVCTINETKLLRYATRRGCKDQIKNILDTAKQNEIID